MRPLLLCSLALLCGALRLSPNVTMEWIIDDSSGRNHTGTLHVHLEIAAEEVAWVGMGFADPASPGEMRGADVFMARPGGVSDCFVGGTGLPATDSTQDWALRDFSVEDSTVTVEVSRALHTGHADDRTPAFVPGVATPIIFAYAAGDAQTLYHGIDTRGHADVVFVPSAADEIEVASAFEGDSEGRACVTVEGGGRSTGASLARVSEGVQAVELYAGSHCEAYGALVGRWTSAATGDAHALETPSDTVMPASETYSALLFGKGRVSATVQRVVRPDFSPAHPAATLVIDPAERAAESPSAVAPGAVDCAWSIAYRVSAEEPLKLWAVTFLARAPGGAPSVQYATQVLTVNGATVAVAGHTTLTLDVPVVLKTGDTVRTNVSATSPANSFEGPSVADPVVLHVSGPGATRARLLPDGQAAYVPVRGGGRVVYATATSFADPRCGPEQGAVKSIVETAARMLHTGTTGGAAAVVVMITFLSAAAFACTLTTLRRCHRKPVYRAIDIAEGANEEFVLEGMDEVELIEHASDE